MPGLRTAVACLLVATLGACSEGSPASTCEEVPRDGIVELERNGRRHCLGVVVDDDWVLTAQHCVQDVEHRWLAVRSADSVHAVGAIVLRTAPTDSLPQLHGQDLALLHVSDLGQSPAGLGSPAEDDACVARVTRRYSEAPIHAVESTAVYAAPKTTPGDSGGPLVDLDGSVVGITSWRTDRGAASVFTRVDVHEGWIWDVIDGAE